MKFEAGQIPEMEWRFKWQDGVGGSRGDDGDDDDEQHVFKEIVSFNSVCKSFMAES